jgi:hypothetical protein
METTDEKIYRRVEHKDIFVKRIERVLKVMAVDCVLNKNINVFHNMLKRDVDGSRECDYMNCDYQCEGFGPQGPDPHPEINTDTYNLYFSEPQIKKVEQYIIDLFSVNFALTLDNMILEIQQRLPGIEDMFIYEALDRILGSPPQKPSILVYDRFGRAGHVIYSDPYYVFQPEELSDPKAPLYYKMTPASHKLAHISLKKIQAPQPSAPLQIKAQTQQAQDQAVPSLEQEHLKPIIGKLVEILAQPTPAGYPSSVYNIHSIIDRQSFAIQSQLFEHISLEAHRPSSPLAPLATVLIQYYVKRGHVLQHENVKAPLSHRLNIADLAEPDPNAHFRNLQQIDQEWIWTDATPADESWLRQQFQSKIDTRPPDYQGIVGFIKYHDNKKIYQLSLVNYMEERIQTTKVKLQDIKKGLSTEPGISRKSMKTGRVCNTCNLNESLVPIAQQLGLKRTDYQRDKMCEVLELRLRELDNTSPRKMFYYPGEKLSRK